MAKETTTPASARQTGPIPKRLQVSKQRLADVQRMILRWLHTEAARRRQSGQAVEIAYPDLVRDLRIDKAEIALGLRHLLHQGFVSVSLPRGSWVRYVSITKQGSIQATALSKQQRQQRFKQYVTAEQDEDDYRHYTGRSARRRTPRYRRRTWEC